MNKDLYKILQVDPAADPEVIEAAYLRLTGKISKQPAADPAQDQSRLTELELAYSVLSSPVSRMQYDRGEFQFKVAPPPELEHGSKAAPTSPPIAGEMSLPIPGSLRQIVLTGLLVLPLAAALLTGLSAMPELARQIAFSYQISRPAAAPQQSAADIGLSINPREIDLEMVLSIPQDKALNIRRVVATNDSLFLLDGARNRVLRVARGEPDELDLAFECGSGEAITDIAPANRILSNVGSGNDNNLLAITAQGKLFICSPDTTDFLSLQPPGIGWSGISGLRTFGEGYLLVLDSGSNAIYLTGIYNSPSLYLPSPDPEAGSPADWLPIQEEILILNADGSMLTCIIPNSSAETAGCKAVRFSGPGLPPEGMANLADLKFSQLAANQPSEQSIYLLDAERQQLFHLNRSYEILEVLTPASPLPNLPISAFTISRERILYMVVGGSLFSAQLP